MSISNWNGSRQYYRLRSDPTSATKCERPSLINGRVSLRNPLFRPNARISKTRQQTPKLSAYLYKNQRYKINLQETN